jgi:oligosaccharide repeat unit polymerase
MQTTILAISILILSLSISYSKYGTIRTPIGLYGIVWNVLLILNSLNYVDYISLSSKASSLLIMYFLMYLVGYTVVFIFPKNQYNPTKRLSSSILKKPSNKYQFAIRASILISFMGLVFHLLEVVKLLGYQAIFVINPYVFRLYGPLFSKIFSHIIITFSMGGSVLAGLLVARGGQFRPFFLLLYVPPIVKAFITGERALGIWVFLSSIIPIIIVYRKDQNTSKHQQNVMLISMISMLVAFFIFIGIKRSVFGSGEGIGSGFDAYAKNIYTYLTGSFTAFSVALNTWSGEPMWGVHTFKPIYQMLNVIGVTSIDPVYLRNVGVMGFVSIPFLFNVFGSIWDVILDYGYLGILLVPLLIGIYSHIVWKKSNSRNEMNLYDLLLVAIVFYLLFGVIGSITTFTPFWYGYGYAAVVLVFIQKSEKRHI